MNTRALIAALGGAEAAAEQGPEEQEGATVNGDGRGDPKLFELLLDFGHVRRLAMRAYEDAMAASLASGGGKVGENLTPRQIRQRVYYRRRKALAGLTAIKACCGKILEDEARR